MVRLTVVNDHPELRDLIGEILEADRHETTLVESVEEDLLQQICLSEPDLLIIDLRHGDQARHGWEIVQELRGISGCENLPVVLCSADIEALNDLEPELETAPRTMALKLPFEIDALLRSVRSLISAQEDARCSSDRT